MENNANHIIIPVDFSEQSQIAIGQSYNLARLTKAEITLLHILAKKSDHTKEADEKLQALASGISKETGSKTNIRIEYGAVEDKIIVTATELKAKFIVMALHSKNKMGAYLGSHSLRVVRKAPCPVITIRGKQHRVGCKTIVLPLDFTKETRQKVKNVIEFAKYYDSHVKIVSVITTGKMIHKNKILSYAIQARDMIFQKGIPCTADVVEGDNISKMIIDYAVKKEADLLMIMTQQEKSIKDFFIGSAAEQIIKTSDIPVLSIRPVKQNVKYASFS